MTPPPSAMAFDPSITPGFAIRGSAGATFLVLALVFAVLTLFPRNYSAETELLPQTTGGGLSSILQQAGGALLDLGSLTGNKQSIEADLTISRSFEVLRQAMLAIKPAYPNRIGDLNRTAVKLKNHIGIIAIRGSIVQITVHDRDPAFAKDLAAALAHSLQNRLAQLSLTQASQKRTVTEDRLHSASDRLFRAQQALTEFRAVNHLAAPEQQLGAGVSVLAALQSQLQAREAALQALSQIATPQNIQYRQLQSEIAGLRAQIASAQKSVNGNSGFNLGAISQVNAQYLNLFRDERLADALFQVYTKYMEELTIDELSARQNMDIIEPPYVKPERQYNLPALALLVLTLLFAVLAELYTVRPPYGRVPA